DDAHDEACRRHPLPLRLAATNRAPRDDAEDDRQHRENRRDAEVDVRKQAEGEAAYAQHHARRRDAAGLGPAGADISAVAELVSARPGARRLTEGAALLRRLVLGVLRHDPSLTCAASLHQLR